MVSTQLPFSRWDSILFLYNISYVLFELAFLSELPWFLLKTLENIIPGGKTIYLFNVSHLQLKLVHWKKVPKRGENICEETTMKVPDFNLEKDWTFCSIMHSNE